VSKGLKHTGTCTHTRAHNSSSKCICSLHSRGHVHVCGRQYQGRCQIHNPRGDCSGPVADPSLQFRVLHESPAVFGLPPWVNSDNIHCHEEYGPPSTIQAASYDYEGPCSFNFVLPAYTAFFIASSSPLPLLYSSLMPSYYLFGSRARLVFVFSGFQESRPIFSLVIIGLVRSLRTLSSPHSAHCFPSYPILTPQFQFKALYSQILNNSYPYIYLMSYFVTYTPTFTFIPKLTTHDPPSFDRIYL